MNIASNYDVAEISTKKIYSTEKKVNVSVLWPVIVQHYNSLMGGVNKLDQLWNPSKTEKMAVTNFHLLF